jgi:hypothetical protein
MGQVIKDNHGRIIGSTSEQINQILMKDEHGHIVGYYRKNEDATYDEHGRRVGSGNLLTMLLKK